MVDGEEEEEEEGSLGRGARKRQSRGAASLMQKCEHPHKKQQRS